MLANLLVNEDSVYMSSGEICDMYRGHPSHTAETFSSSAQSKSDMFLGWLIFSLGRLDLDAMNRSINFSFVISME